ncbi:MAG: heavy metal translocating P-type ATPase [Clostridia bacterium]|nr:heavy metal translocating P-type ATPase [Clostridia bacterium]
MTDKKFTVSGMTCAACQANVTKTVAKLDGAESVDVNLLTGRMVVVFDETKLTAEQIKESVNAIGYHAEDEAVKDSQSKMQWNSHRQTEEKNSENMKWRLIFSITLLIPLMYIAMGGMLGLPLPSFFKGEENALISAFTQFLITIPVLILNRKFFISGFKALIKRVPNMDSLVALGSSASVIYGIFAIYRMMQAVKTGNMHLLHRYAHSLYFESGAMILTLVSVGKFLETRSKAKTSETLEKLVALAPKRANIIRNGKEISVATEEINVGDLVVIRPGESVPVDGEVISGGGYVDQSAITGESIPVRKKRGDTVISATINKSGSFTFKASKVGDDTTLSQIIRMVDEAGSSKAPIARLADKISGVFVPVVMGISVITLIAWLIAGKGFEFALNCAVSVLVISCPCALGLATPVAIMAGTGKAAELGILVKSATSLETLHSINTVVLDKTGTVTNGEPSVTDIIPFKVSENELLALAGSLESKSEHPLGKAVISKAKERNLKLLAVDDFESVSGRGVKAKIDGCVILGGNEKYIEENGIEFDKAEIVKQLASSGKTPLIFAKDNELLGIIAVADTIKETSIKAVKDLHNMKIDTVLLTGDNALSAKAIGKEAGIENVVSDVMPADKEREIRKLQELGRKTAMIGDGINDAPALTRADVGIAIGKGTDIAIESADVVLMKSSLGDAVTAIKLSRSVMKNIKMNLFWAFFYNALGIPLAAGVFYPVFGILLSPMIGSLAMSLSSLCVVLNALRLRRFKADNDDEEIEKGEINMIKVLKVEGMMCQHCKAHVQKALEAVEGVKAVDVDLESKTATVELLEDVDTSVLEKAVTDAGYEVIS